MAGYVFEIFMSVCNKKWKIHEPFCIEFVCMKDHFDIKRPTKTDTAIICVSFIVNTSEKGRLCKTIYTVTILASSHHVVA